MEANLNTKQSDERHEAWVVMLQLFWYCRE